MEATKVHHYAGHPHERRNAGQVHQVNRSQSGISNGQKKPIRARLKVVGDLIRKSPHIAIIPALVLALLLGLGIWGVFAGIHARRDQARENAQYEVRIASETIKDEASHAGVLLNQMVDFCRVMPQYEMLQNSWNAMTESLWKGTPRGTEYVILAPQGYANFVVSVDNQVVKGADLLTGPFIWKDTLLSVLQTQQDGVRIAGPFRYPSDPKQTPHVFFTTPIFVNTTATPMPWNLPAVSPLCTDPKTANMCQSKTGKRWWGFIALSMDIASFLRAVEPIQGLASKGYQYQFYTGPATAQEMVYGTRTNGPPPADALEATLTVVDQEWTLYMWKDNWKPVWLLPILTVVVVGSIGIAVLIFIILLSRAEHRALLHTLLPKATIERMRNQFEWTNSQHQEQMLQGLHLETPARHMLTIISACLEDKAPSVQLLLAVRDALHRTADVYRPTAADFKDRLEASHAIDAEVRQALVAQLMHDNGAQEDFTPGAHAEDEPYRGAEGPISNLTTHTTITPSLLKIESRSKFPVPGSIGYAGLDVENDVSDRLLSVSEVGPGRLTPETRTSSAGALMDRISALPTGSSQQLKAALMVLMRQAGSLNGDDVSVCGSVEKAGVQGGVGDSGSQGVVVGVEQLHQALPQPQPHRPSQAGAAAGQLPHCPRVQSDTTSLAGFNCFNVVLPSRPMWTKLELILVGADDWGFDAFALEEASCGHPLSVLGYYLIAQSGLMQWGHIDPPKLIRFLQAIERGYPNANPYHNKRHAAEVLQAMHMLVTQGGLMPGFVDQCGLLACYLAAIIHDYEHRGRNNDYLVNSHDELAVRYNDKSPMENHHLAAAWNLLRSQDLNCLGGLPKPTWLKLRKLIIDLVLSTDMKQHFAILGQFDALHRATTPSSSSGASDKPSSSPGTEQFAAGPGSDTPAAATSHSASSTQAPYLVPVSDNDRTLSLQMALKCADLANLAAPLHVYLKWVRCLEEEFFQQGDAEREQGLALSPLCDRTKAGVSKSQVGFYDFVCIPLFKAYSTRFPGALPMMNGLMSNYKYWQTPSSSTSTDNGSAPEDTTEPASKSRTVETATSER